MIYSIDCECQVAVCWLGTVQKHSTERTPVRNVLFLRYRLRTGAVEVFPPGQVLPVETLIRRRHLSESSSAIWGHVTDDTCDLPTL